MNRLKNILLLILIHFSFFCRSQHQIGVQVDLNKDFLSMNDPGGQFENGSGIHVSAEFSYRYIFKNDLFIASGLSFKQYKSYISMKKLQANMTSSDNMDIQIPLEVGYRITILKNLLHISPMLGFTLNNLLFNSGNSSSGKISTNDDSLSYVASTRYLSSFFPMLSFGGQVEYTLLPNFIMAITIRYNKGFNDIYAQEIVYRHNIDPPVKAVQSSNGSYLTFFGLKFMFVLKDPKNKDKKENDVQIK